MVSVNLLSAQLCCMPGCDIPYFMDDSTLNISQGVTVCVALSEFLSVLTKIFFPYRCFFFLCKGDFFFSKEGRKEMF